MERQFEIYVPKYTKWQKKMKRRYASLISNSLYSDGKVMQAMAESPEAVHVYLACIFSADEDGYWTPTETELKLKIRQTLCVKSPKFDPLSRLEIIARVQLVTVTVNGKPFIELPKTKKAKSRPEPEPQTVIEEVEQRPLLEMKVKQVKENAKKKQYSSESKQLGHYMEQRLKSLGIDIQNKGEMYKEYQVAESLLKSYPLEEIKQAIDWFINHDFYGRQATSLYFIKNHYSKYQADRSKAQKAGTTSEHPKYAMRQGKYYWDGNDGTDPTFDETIPFEMKDLNCQCRWLEAKEMVVGGDYVRDYFDDPKVQTYIVGMCEAYENFMNLWRSEYKVIKATTGGKGLDGEK